MPIFEYRCDECGQRFDAFFRRPEEAEEKGVTCSKCDSENVRKLFSVIGLGGSERSNQNDSCSPRSR
jgi:putative FmdB family regulatory protein